jgi:hypothetical protein
MGRGRDGHCYCGGRGVAAMPRRRRHPIAFDYRINFGESPLRVDYTLAYAGCRVALVGGVLGTSSYG